MITAKLFNQLFPVTNLNPRKYNLVRRRDELINALNKFLPLYGIDNHSRVCAFLANCGIETDYFKTTSEYADGWDYDISVDPAKARGLGNFSRGDGPKFKGSGLTQTTGKNNFKAVQKVIGKRLGVDVVVNPEILRENIEIAVESACIFWQDNDLNKYADGGYFKELSGLVNRGDWKKLPLHWSKRKMLYSVLKSKFPKDFSFAPASMTTATVEPLPATLIGDSSNTATIDPTATAEPTAQASAAGMSLKDFSDKYLKHTPTDTVKNVLGTVSARISTSIGGIWLSGITGKVFLILTAAAVTFVVGRALYYYWPRVTGWAQTLAEGLFFRSEQNG